MANYKKLFMNYLDMKGVRYNEPKEHSVRVTYSGDNMPSIPISILFDKEGKNYVQYYCWDIGNFKDKFAAAVLACNDLNNEYRWVKFCVDDDQDIACSMDAVIDEATCGEECYNLLQRIVDIIDEAYPKFMKIRWSED